MKYKTEKHKKEDQFLYVHSERLQERIDLDKTE